MQPPAVHSRAEPLSSTVTTAAPAPGTEGTGPLREVLVAAAEAAGWRLTAPAPWVASLPSGRAGVLDLQLSRHEYGYTVALVDGGRVRRDVTITTSSEGELEITAHRPDVDMPATWRCNRWSSGEVRAYAAWLLSRVAASESVDDGIGRVSQEMGE